MGLSQWCAAAVMCGFQQRNIARGKWRWDAPHLHSAITQNLIIMPQCDASEGALGSLNRAANKRQRRQGQPQHQLNHVVKLHLHLNRHKTMKSNRYN